MSEMTRASSNKMAVPTPALAAPGPQESLWAPSTTYRSVKGDKIKTSAASFTLQIPFMRRAAFSFCTRKRVCSLSLNLAH